LTGRTVYGAEGVLSMEQATDVLVAGAGPTGLLIAVELRRRGQHVVVVDRAQGPSPYCRALAIQMRTLEVFEQVGVLRQAIDAGLVLRAANFYRDGRKVHRFEIDPAPRSGWPFPFVLSLEQNETERILRERLEQLGGTVAWRTGLVALRPDAGGVTATLGDDAGRTRQLTARYLVGCDGADSTTRTLLGIPFQGTSSPRPHLLADVLVSTDLAADESHRFMAGDQVLVVWPIKGSGRFFLTGPEHGNGSPRLRQPNLEDLRSLCRVMLPGPVMLSEPRWLARYQVHSRIAREFRADRVFLAGDAAHIHPTTGAQGLNTSIQDAYNLAWKLSLALTSRARPVLLDSYQAERRPVAEEVLRASQTGFQSQPRDPVQARQQIVSTFSQVNVSYRDSPIVLDAGATGPDVAVRAGDRAPDAPLTDARSGRQLRLFELIQGVRHTLLTFDPDPGPAEAIARRFPDLIDVRHVRAPGAAAYSPERAPAYVDELGEVGATYGATSPTLVLIRPDGYLAFRGPAEAAGELAGLLDTILVR
jgi:2-polyprenyl-6-methoxyphenol hydroxylase-like FAD-dependent oxidoreductase